MPWVSSLTVYQHSQEKTAVRLDSRREGAGVPSSGCSGRQRSILKNVQCNKPSILLRSSCTKEQFSSRQGFIPVFAPFRPFSVSYFYFKYLSTVLFIS
nr:MAG TPA: hypothetical protein [Inoviridae sp.]